MGLWEIVSLEKQIKAMYPVFNSFIEKPRTHREKRRRQRRRRRGALIRTTLTFSWHVLLARSVGFDVLFIYFFFYILNFFFSSWLPHGGDCPNPKSC